MDTNTNTTNTDGQDVVVPAADVTVETSTEETVEATPTEETVEAAPVTE